MLVHHELTTIVASRLVFLTVPLDSAIKLMQKKYEPTTYLDVNIISFKSIDAVTCFMVLLYS